MSKEGLFHTWSKKFSGGSWWVFIYLFYLGGGGVGFSTKIKKGKNVLILNITNSTNKY